MNDDTAPARWVASPVPERIPTGAAGLSKIANLHGRLHLAISQAAGNLLWVACKWADSESATDKLGNRRFRGMSLRCAKQDGGRPGLPPSGRHGWGCSRARVACGTYGTVM